MYVMVLTICSGGRGLERLIDAHRRLTTAGLRLNSAFCETYFAVISGSVWGVTARAYAALYWYFSSPQIGESLLQMNWMIFWLVVIFAAVIPCSNAHAEASFANFTTTT